MGDNSTSTVEPTLVRLPAPERPPFSDAPPRFLIVGAGNRGIAYATAISESTNGICAGVVEPIAVKRKLLGRRYIWGDATPSEGQEFEDWRQFAAWELERRERAAAGHEMPQGVDGIFICVQDQMHKDVVLALAPLGLHIMCEKPLAPNLDDCVSIYRALLPNVGSVFAIGHVLRYSPHNMLLRKLLLEDKVIGDIMSVNHTEPVGWWHFTHSYVRGYWRNESASSPSLLAKSCHDMDILYWLLSSPPPGSARSVHLPSSISSAGSLQYFTKAHKPAAAGKATNCLSCGYERSCQFSAKRIYAGSQMGSRKEHFVSIVLPEIEDCVTAGGVEAGEQALRKKLSEDYDSTTPTAEIRKRPWFGRCVYESDNDVCDNQTVTLSWDNVPETGRGSKTATLHMVAFSKKLCQRFTNIYGEHGDIYADSDTITVNDFRTGETKTHYPPVPRDGGHGDGDAGLARQFILAVDRVKNHGEGAAAAQNKYLGCSLDDMIRSHALVFAAEEARKGKTVVDFLSWWDREVVGKL